MGVRHTCVSSLQAQLRSQQKKRQDQLPEVQRKNLLDDNSPSHQVTLSFHIFLMEAQTSG